MTMTMDPPLVRPSLKLNQSTIIHLEDQEAYEPPLKHMLRRQNIAYFRTSLVSEAGALIHNQNVVGFIIDLRLPSESVSQFQEWGSFARTSIGLIKKVRQERPELPVVIFTLYHEDPDLQKLVREGLITHLDIFTKMDSEDEAIIESLVARLRTNHPEYQLWVPADMDPNLQYLVAAARRGYRPQVTASTRDGEVAVLARITDLEAWQNLVGVRSGIAIPSGDYWLVTGRVQMEQVETVQRQPFIDSLQAAERLQPMESVATNGGSHHNDFKTFLGTGNAGRGVVVGVVDFGCDFVHRRFRNADGSTRLLALWDQTGSREEPCEYGTLYEKKRINATLLSKAGDPALAQYYEEHVQEIKDGTHGTHVMDIAAGGREGDWKPGIAPDADLIFVELSAADIPWEGPEVLDASLGDSVHFVEALEFIFRTAGDRPCVINASLGVNTGPHDGTSLLEQAIDTLVTAAPNRAVVFAAGNDSDRGIHTTGIVPWDGYLDLKWRVEKGKKHLKLEVWYSGQDAFAAELLSPSGESLCQVGLGSNSTDSSASGLPRFVLAHQQNQNNNANVIGVFLGPRAEAGDWCLRLNNDHLTDGLFHAWIESERLDNRCASFLSPDPDWTLNSVACGRESFAVGSYNEHLETFPCSSFSGSGPTRDGRHKPDLCAPGERIVAACSHSSDPIEKTGTSMAAPVLTGFIARLLSNAHAEGRSLIASEIREAVHKALRKNHQGWDRRYGWGCLLNA